MKSDHLIILGAAAIGGFILLQRTTTPILQTQAAAAGATAGSAAVKSGVATLLTQAVPIANAAAAIAVDYNSIMNNNNGTSSVTATDPTSLYSDSSGYVMSNGESAPS